MKMTQEGSGAFDSRLNNYGIADLDETFGDDCGYLGKDQGYGIFTINDLDFDWQAGREFKDFGGMEHSVATVAGDTSEDADARYLTPVADLHYGLIHWPSRDLIGLINIDSKFFGRSALHHGSPIICGLRLHRV